MTKSSLLCGLAVLLTFQSFSTANFIYHEHTMNTVGGSCGVFVSNLSPTSADAVVIQFAIDYQGFTNRARIYYTTDGTIPTGDHGTGFGTTQVLTAAYVCTYTDGFGDVVDVVQATIPPQPVGTTVNYIVSAWHTGGGPSGQLEIFGNSGNVSASTGATDFSFSFSAALPLQLIDFAGKKINDNVQLLWTTQQELNLDHYEIYRSSNGVQFQSIGTKKAVGITTLTNSYYFTDANTYRGNNFYKIKSVDKDGHFSFTHVVKLSFDNRSFVTIHVFGNILHITLSSTLKDKYSIRLVNNLGQVIRSYSILHDGINTSHDLNLPTGLSRNIYHIIVDATGMKYSQSILN
ncbi:MAG: hypothetical protein ABJA57_00240 [Ginsengibacter sp.]